MFQICTFVPIFGVTLNISSIFDTSTNMNTVGCIVPSLRGVMETCGLCEVRGQRSGVKGQICDT